MRRGLATIVWSFVLIGIGTLFLLGNFFPEFRPWRLIARYWSAPWLLFARFWPVLIIVWGISKLRSYINGAHDPAIGRNSLLTGGDVVLLIFLLVFGTAATGITRAVRGSRNWEHNWIRNDGVEFDLFGSGKKFEFREEVTQRMGDAVAVEVVNKHGGVELLVHDSPELKVKLVKMVRAGEEARGREIANQLKIVLERQDRGIRLSTTRDSLPEEWRRGLETHFTIWVPKSTALRVFNRYGRVTIDGISGNHAITNANGPVTIRNIEGNLQVDNKYGPVNAASVTGDCSISNKYGPIALEEVGGKTEVENAYGPVDLKKLRGYVKLSNRYGHVICVDLASGLAIDGQYAEIKGQNIRGDVQIETSYKDVELQDVLGSINVRGKHGDIDIKASQPPVKPIFVEAEYSGVEIILPKDSSFEVEATSKYGKFLSGFDSVNVTQSSTGKRQLFRGSHGTGGPTITIRTSYRDISLNPS
jgi:hypothetical protein